MEGSLNKAGISPPNPSTGVRSENNKNNNNNNMFTTISSIKGLWRILLERVIPISSTGINQKLNFL